MTPDKAQETFADHDLEHQRFTNGSIAGDDDRMATASAFKDITATMRDGVKLYGRHYPRGDASKRDDHKDRRPVLCLAGLTRNSRDFNVLALALSQHATTPRDVFTLDMRGRGRSEFDKDWRNYSVPLEAQDVIDFMAMQELEGAGIVGTSRGGLITMALAAMQPSRLGAVVLNDIGPVIERDGLIRIAGYVGKIPHPKTWAEATTIVQQLTKRDFPKLTDAGAEQFARQLYNDDNGKPARSYDSKLANALAALKGPLPVLWPQFDAMRHVPMMVIRGGNSDLLSEKTVDDMQRRHPRLTRLTVPDEGHAPLLSDAPTITAIADFFAQYDDDRHAAARGKPALKTTVVADNANA